MNYVIKALSVALLLTMITPAYGMLRTGLMAVRVARHIMKQSPSQLKLTPTQGVFTTTPPTTGWYNRAWLRRSAIGAAALPSCVSLALWNNKMVATGLKAREIKMQVSQVEETATKYHRIFSDLMKDSPKK